MAKVTITLTDEENDMIDLNVDFDPPLPNITKDSELSKLTSAQVSAITMLASVADSLESVDNVEGTNGNDD